MGKKTRIIVHHEGAPAELYLRGEGGGLDWQKGTKLIPKNEDEWIWETDEPFQTGKFKVLINDKTYELGTNHDLYPGASIRVNPKFPEE